MAELYPSDAELSDLGGTTDDEQEVLFIPTGESPYYISFYRMLYRLLDVSRRAGDLRVYKDGDLTFGVRAGRFMDGATTRDYAGSTANALTNNQTNYIYLTTAGALTVNTTGFPGAATTAHVPLATIVTAAGAYAHDDITDYRGRAIFQAVNALTPAEMTEAHDFFAATDITGAQAETLSDGSNADALHVHDTAGLADGAVTNAKVASDAAVARSKLAQETATRAIPLSSLRKTDHYYGALLGGGGVADCLNLMGGVHGTSTPYLESKHANDSTETSKARFEFPLPPEYVAGGSITLRLRARTSPTAEVSSTLDAEVSLSNREGGKTGGDLCATAAQDINSATWADYDFTITPTGLSAGDMLDVELTTDVDDTGGTGARAYIGSVQMLLAVKG